MLFKMMSTGTYPIPKKDIKNSVRQMPRGVGDGESVVYVTL